MQNRFNRPFGPEHVEALIHKLREAAMARQESDALQVLEATEAKLRDSLEKQSIAEAALALAEVERLKGMIRMPLQSEAWGEGQRTDAP